MPDPNPNPNPNPNPDPNPNPAPQPNPNPAPAAFDPAKVGDEDFGKIFDDPRVWKHPRFAELTQAAKDLKELKAAQAEAEKKKLADNKQFEELAKRNEQERDDWKNKYTSSLVDNAIMAEASKKGITDLDAAKKLIDRSKIKVNEDGSIEGVTEAVDTLVADKKYLVGAKRDIGRGTNPPGTEANDGKFTVTQIQDPIFYQKNRDAIMAAQAKGEIIDDRA